MTGSDSPHNTKSACQQFEQRLMMYLERDLPPDESLWMDQHHGRCVACRSMMRELDEIVEQAGELPPVSPTRDLWPEIESRLITPAVHLENGGLARSAKQFAAASDAGPAVRSSSPRWSTSRLAIAATLLVALSSAVTWQLTRPTMPMATVAGLDTGVATAAVVPVANTVNGVYQNEIEALRSIVAERYTELDTATVTALQTNLAIIDKAIEDCKRALAQDPNSAVLSGSLDRALASKLALMRRVALL